MPVSSCTALVASFAPPVQPRPFIEPYAYAELILSVAPRKPIDASAGMCATMSRGIEIMYARSCVAVMCRIIIVSDREVWPLVSQPSRVSRPSSSRFIPPLGNLPVIALPVPLDVSSSTLDVVWMLLVSWLRKYLAPTMPLTLTSIRTAPKTMISFAHSGARGGLGVACTVARRPASGPP